MVQELLKFRVENSYIFYIIKRITLLMGTNFPYGTIYKYIKLARTSQFL